MGSEPLESCPVCGAKILPSVVPMYDDGSDASTASCFNGKCLYRVRRENHNTLARRAEIGALIERIVAGGCCSTRSAPSLRNWR